MLNTRADAAINTITCTMPRLNTPMNLPPRIVAREVGVVNRRGSVPSSSSRKIDCAITRSCKRRRRSFGPTSRRPSAPRPNRSLRRLRVALRRAHRQRRMPCRHSAACPNCCDHCAVLHARWLESAPRSTSGRSTETDRGRANGDRRPGHAVDDLADHSRDDAAARWSASDRAQSRCCSRRCRDSAACEKSAGMITATSASALIDASTRRGFIVRGR